MKKTLALIALCAAMSLFNGCIVLSFTSDDRPVTQAPTVGQQLLDLQAARDTGAITEEEFDAKKARLLK